MSDNPTVCAVMLTADRPEMARRAVECFRAQTYPAKRLLTYNTGDGELYWDYDPFIAHHRYRPVGTHRGDEPIGAIRNWANEEAQADILIHWDDDDYSHPNRIAEQVALLQSSGADAVGYREMLFWREAATVVNWKERAANHESQLGEAWLYSNLNPSYCLGTSLCYWRKTWERKPFEATSQGEDFAFCAGLKTVSVTSIFDVHNDPFVECLPNGDADKTPRMIATIHSGNTSVAYRTELMRQAEEWQRVPEWDDYARKVMEC